VQWLHALSNENPRYGHRRILVELKATQRLFRRRRRSPPCLRRCRLAEYLLRAPFSLEKITYNAKAGSVLYRSDRHWRTKRNFEVFSASQFIAALLDQVPPKGVPQVRYYGWYSNKSRGLRQRTASTAAGKTHAAAGPLGGS